MTQTYKRNRLLIKLICDTLFKVINLPLHTFNNLYTGAGVPVVYKDELNGGNNQKGGFFYVNYFNETIVGGRGSLWPPNTPLEPENETLHFYGKKRHLHHRPTKNGQKDGRSL